MTAIKWVNEPSVLDKADQFLVWKYVMTSSFQANEFASELLSGAVTVTTAGEGLSVRRGNVILDAATGRLDFLRVEAAMKGFLVRTVSQQIATQLLSNERFFEMW